MPTEASPVGARRASGYSTGRNGRTWARAPKEWETDRAIGDRGVYGPWAR